MRLSGVIDARQVSELWRRRDELFAHNELDLSEVSHVDSAGLAFLVKWAKSLQQLGERLRLNGASSRLGKLIELYAVEPLFDLQMHA